MKPLTREQTEGTLTFFFPRRRGAEAPPEVTLMVLRTAGTPNMWQAGLAMCSQGDMFSKKLGRKIAYHRLLGCPISANNPLELLREVAQRIEEVTRRRPFPFSLETIQQLPNITQRLQDMRVGV